MNASTKRLQPASAPEARAVWAAGDQDRPVLSPVNVHMAHLEAAMGGVVEEPEAKFSRPVRALTLGLGALMSWGTVLGLGRAIVWAVAHR